MKVESLRRLSRASNSPENCLTLVWALQSTPQCTAFFEERSPTDAESVGFETCSGTGSATGVATEEAPEVEVEGVGHSQIAQTSESNLQLAPFSQPGKVSFNPHPELTDDPPISQRRRSWGGGGPPRFYTDS